tara:strand:- start:1030 stop:1971 length:942 start_codon:yes stop_codon:yes gene_type:complete
MAHTLGLTDINQRILNENSVIESRNTERKNLYQKSLTDIATLKTKKQGDIDADTTSQKESTGQGVLDFYESAKSSKNLVSNFYKNSKSIVGDSGIELEEAQAWAPGRVVNILSMGKGGGDAAGAGRAVNILSLGDATSEAAAPIMATHVAPALSIGKGVTNADEILNTGSSIVKGFKNLGEMGSLAKAATGLQIGLGALDAYEDISHGKIEGDTPAEKVSNVADMVGGGAAAAFAVGTALDATFIGAPVGLALQAAAGLAGLVSAGADIFQDESEKTQTKKQVTSLVPPPKPLTQSTQAIIAQGSTGQEVKVN